MATSGRGRQPTVLEPFGVWPSSRPGAVEFEGTRGRGLADWGLIRRARDG